ncbi:MAG: hypothetical protein ACJAS4_002992 [Bacteriovoracaceae bacterium]|jgi:hypothetical protein
MSEDEDKPTVVIDFDSIKSQLQEEEELLESGKIVLDDLELEFGSLESLIGEEDEYSPNISVYLFTFKTTYFKTNSQLTKGFDFTKALPDLTQLNDALSNDPTSIVVFYYNSSPKIVNQLSMQIKDKFPLAKTIIIAKNLSPEKAQQHHSSKYGANSYLNDPFSDEDFLKTIQNLENN